jgi:hypothetical protein
VSARIFRLDRKINSWKTLLTLSPSLFPHVKAVSAQWINHKVMASDIYISAVGVSVVITIGKTEVVLLLIFFLSMPIPPDLSDI